MTSDRQDANNAAANQVTKTIYRPVALALSNEFGKDIGYLLQRN